MTLRFYPPIIALAACLGLACSDDSEPTLTTSGASAASTNPSTSPTAPSTDPSAGTDATDSTDGTDGTGTDATTDGPATDATTSEPTTSAATTMGAETTGTTEPPPTDGPGVLPGEDGMDAFCRRYKECGGTYYDDQQACLDATYDYWGDCPSRKAALDAFGACMSELDCADWSPDAYNPNSTPCAAEWGEVGASDPC